VRTRLVLANILAVAACALVYELVLGTLASYTLGNAVREFSITIGLYLASMGLGALVSGKVGERVAERYVQAELLLAICGGASVPVLFAFTGAAPTGGGATLRVLVYVAVTVVGALVGLELPLLVRLSKAESSFADAVSRALAFDYAGALVAALAFPTLLVPRLGLVRASLATGVVNALCALSATWILAPALGKRRLGLRAASALVTCGLVLVLVHVNPASLAAE
jgi:spermidine synthase